MTDTHTDRWTDIYTTTACTVLSIASHGKIDHIARVSQSIITMQATSVGWQQIVRQSMKYLNDNAQTPLNRFVVYMLYNQVCNRHGDKSNQWSLGLSLSVRRAWPQARRTAIYSSPSSATLFIVARRVNEENMFLTSQLCIQKMRHVSKATVSLRVICHPFGQTWYSLPLYKVWEL